jgi:hypothetical protein
MTAIAVVACGSADASAPQAHAALVHPDGWRQLPAIAVAVTAAAASHGARVDAVEAWGEPAMGCYAVGLELRGGPAGAQALADEVLRGVAGLGTLAVSDVVAPTGPDGVLAFAFAAAPYHGRLRARLAAGRIAAIACFANQREPAACAAACGRVLGGAP